MRDREKAFSSAEVAEMLGLSPLSIHVYARRYEVGRKIGPVWIFDKRDVEEIRSRMKKPREAEAVSA